MRREILMAGLGWISSGIICIAVWLLELGRGNSIGLFWTGLIVIIIGTWLLFLNKTIEAMMIRFQAEAKEKRLREGGEGGAGVRRF